MGRCNAFDHECLNGAASASEVPLEPLKQSANVTPVPLATCQGMPLKRIYAMHHHSNSVSGYLQPNLKSQNWAYVEKKTKKSIRKIIQSREGSKKKRGESHTKGR